MNALLLNRTLGALSPAAFQRHETSRLLHALQPTPFRFDGSAQPDGDALPEDVRAHAAGVNSMTVDKFEGRYLLSGGADSSICMWDLESREGPSVNTFYPLGALRKYATHAAQHSLQPIADHLSQDIDSPQLRHHSRVILPFRLSRLSLVLV